MKRRGFLKSLAASAGVLSFLPEVAEGLSDRLSRLSADLESASGPALWQRARKEFQLHPGLIHLNCGSLGATPRVVIDAVSSCLRDVEGNPATKTFNWGRDAMEAVRTQAADFIGADVEEVAITRNTTEAMNAVATGIDLEPGDQVLTTNHEHGGGMVCWQYLRKHRGIEIKYFTMPKVVSSKQEIVELVRDHLAPRTKVCSFSHIETINGVIMPMAEIAALTRPKNILLVCDGAQAPGMIPVDVKALGVDTYAYSGHKWLLAPKGSGLLYIRKEVQDRIHPTFLFSGYNSYTASGGTRGVSRIVGYGVTMDFHKAIGRDRITARCRQLNAYLRSQLDEIRSLSCLTSADPELSCALMSYALDKGKAGDVVGRLREHQVILKPAQSTYAFCEEEGLPRESYNAIRFSTHIFNDEADIDRGVEVLRKVLAEM